MDRWAGDRDMVTGSSASLADHAAGGRGACRQGEDDSEQEPTREDSLSFREI